MKDSLTDESRTKALGILDEFSSKHPKANTHQRLALTIADGEPGLHRPLRPSPFPGEKFKELVKPYLERALQKGIPSLFSDVKNLYTDPFKLQSIQDMIEDIRSSVSQPSTSSDPADYLWTLYFLAQHYSSLGQHEKALEILHTAMEHTPTLPELYMTKARVLKRAGDPYGAVRAMDDARRLDGQDRYVNTKSGKYRLRAGMINEADEVLGLFTKVASFLRAAHTADCRFRKAYPPAQTCSRCKRCTISLKRATRRDAWENTTSRSRRTILSKRYTLRSPIRWVGAGTFFFAFSCSMGSARSNTISTCIRFVGACSVLTLRASTSSGPRIRPIRN